MRDIRELYKMASRDLRLASQNYWLNVGFLSGYQWIFWDPVVEQPRDHPVDDRIRFVFNRMALNHRTLIANLMQRPMAYEVFPNGADDASAEAAYVSEEILYAQAFDHRWEHLREKNYANMLKGGTGIIGIDWDEDEDDTVESALSIVEAAVEPGCYDPEKARWWIKVQVFHPEEVKAMFELKKTPPADATNGINPLAERLFEGHLGVEKITPLTMVLTYYERPNHLCEEGQVGVDVGGELVQELEWDFPWEDRLNMVVGTETLVEHQWYGETIYSQARTPQVALNMVKSNLSEHLRDAAVARLLVPHSALRTMEALNDIPGYMHPYPDGLRPPEWLSPPQLSAWIQGLQNDYIADIDDIMGVHDVSRGKAPVNLESGTALAILAELDGTPIGRILKEGAGQISRMASLNLQLLEAKAKDKRLSVIETGDGPVSIEWTGSDINGQYQARVPLESVIPRSRAAMQQMGMKLLEMGQIKTLEEFTTFIEMPGRRNLLDTINRHVAKARRENAALTRGDVPLPATFDNHEAHIQEHNNFRTTPAYERLDPDQQEVVDLHVQAHATMASGALAGQVARAEEHPALNQAPTADQTPPLAPELVPPAPADELAAAEAAEAAAAGAAGPDDAVIGDPAAPVDTLLSNL